MITFTQNQSFGQLYADCHETNQSYRIPAASVEPFLADVGTTLDELLAAPPQRTPEMHAALALYNG